VSNCVPMMKDTAPVAHPSEWGVCDKHVNAIIDSKSAIDIGALLSWPRFASYDEDLALRDTTKWRHYHYDGPRVILWDMTNIPCPKCEDGSLQRTTWSSYYGTNCFKVPYPSL
jgi:hypothetical protein